MRKKKKYWIDNVQREAFNLMERNVTKINAYQILNGIC